VRSTGGVATVGALFAGGVTTLGSGVRTAGSGMRTVGADDSTEGRPVSVGVLVAGAGGRRVSIDGGGGAGALAGIASRTLRCDVGDAGVRRDSAPQITAATAAVASTAPPAMTAARVDRGAGPCAPVHKRLRTSPINGRASGCL
jgi:hypothetical protein